MISPWCGSWCGLFLKVLSGMSSLRAEARLKPPQTRQHSMRFASAKLASRCGSSRRREETRKAAEASIPAFGVLVAVLDAGELFVGDGDLGDVAVGVEVDGDEGVGRGATFPAPGVDELAGRLDE